MKKSFLFISLIILSATVYAQEKKTQSNINLVGAGYGLEYFANTKFSFYICLWSTSKYICGFYLVFKTPLRNFTKNLLIFSACVDVKQFSLFFKIVPTLYVKNNTLYCIQFYCLVWLRNIWILIIRWIRTGSQP